MKIYNSLPHGKKNAVSAEYLVNLHGLKSDRELRRQIQHERMEGAVIASTDQGYFVPISSEELSVYIRRSENMARSIFATLKAARAALNESFDDQMELDLIEH